MELKTMSTMLSILFHFQSSHGGPPSAITANLGRGGEVILYVMKNDECAALLAMPDDRPVNEDDNANVRLPPNVL